MNDNAMAEELSSLQEIRDTEGYHLKFLRVPESDVK
jgi:hypothetical protein